MGIFIGSLKNTTAARVALKINHAVYNIINPALRAQYPLRNFVLRHMVGVDTGKLMAARIGVRNDNDIVWVGRAANYAAKLTELNDSDAVFITNDVFRQLADDSKFGGNPSTLMWRTRTWSQMGDIPVYSSNWTWSF
jgi:class 3 adenylate cyclase